VLHNGGSCALRVTGIASSATEFELPGVVSYPLVVGAGNAITLPIRFRPAGFGPKAGTLSVSSNDAAGVRVIAVSGRAPPPELDLVLADSGDLGKVCVGSFKDFPLTLVNSGQCALTVTGISSSDGQFVAPGVASYPILVASGTAIAMPIRFAPTSFGMKSATVTVTSDDPAGPKSVTLRGEAPSGRLVVTGSTCIGGVKECCLGERTIALCNVGECDLHVKSVAFKRKSPHWKLVNNPFPATLRSSATRRRRSALAPANSSSSATTPRRR
jgi:hypothetical protein